jgi:large subunit ribosomal protein L9
MEVILSGDLKGVGEKGERRNVKPGYARNYLLRQGLAVLPSDTSAKSLESDFKKREVALENTKASENIAESVQNIKLEFILKSEKGKTTYTGITAKKIEEELEKKYQIHADKIDIKGAMKEIGEHPVNITVGTKVFEALILLTSAK